jgi:5-formyltetrahydrofolate cyclo-ligase
LRTKQPIPKAEAKRIVIERSRDITEAELNNKSAVIIDKFTGLDDFIFAQKILLYFSSLKELVNTKSLINRAIGQGKSVFLSKLNLSGNKFRRFQFTSFEDLVKREAGFFEPKFGIEEDLSDIDLIIVPSLAVSLTGQRIGFDFDGYNSVLKKSFVPKVALAFEFQLLHKIEFERKDIFVDRIVTERQIINTREN